ncbi:MAG: Eco57I restriction-modification methylase domain-containing protein, partial [Myxococcaceae bacterium]
NQRTMIAAVVPRSGVGNTLPLLLGLEAPSAALLVALLNSFAFDFVARQKVQGQHLNLFILEQIAVPPPTAFTAGIGAGSTLAHFVRDRVLRLTYNATDMAGFAAEMGHHEPPFPWDGEERRHIMAQLDAALFRIYGLSIEEAGYVLSTFPIIQAQDQEDFGRYRTRDLILAYMRAQQAGDYQSRLAL